MSSLIMLPSWQKAEDAFLAGFSEIKRLSWGDIYVWREHPEWPKFSFIRIRNATMSLEALRLEMSQFKARFSSGATEFYLRIPRELGISAEFVEEFKKDPDSIVSVAYDPSECGNPELAAHLELGRCQTEDDLRLWWEVNSDARERKTPFASALWPHVLRKFKTGTEYYLLWKEKKAVTCGAIERFDEGYNSWGLGTRQSEQNQGYSRAYMSKLAESFGHLIYSQVDLGEPRYTTLTQIPSTRILATEDLYLF